jgi:superfamily II DNA/RNA helicase
VQIYVHRSGRTARADTDGISIAIISPSDRSKYTTLCRALDKVGICSANVSILYPLYILCFLSVQILPDFWVAYSAVMLCAMSILGTR